MREFSVEHRRAWIKHHKKHIPYGYHIHHIDGNPKNNHPSNLLACSPWEHYKIHKRQGDKQAAALLLSKILGSEYSLYGHILDYDVINYLRRQNKSLIHTPRGIPKAKVILEECMLKHDTSYDYFSEKDNIEENKYKIKVLLSSLSEIERKVLIYYYIDKLSFKKISKILNLAPNSLKNVKVRALKKIKNKYEF